MVPCANSEILRESAAELQARMTVNVKHSKPLVTNLESISVAVPKTSWRFSASHL